MSGLFALNVPHLNLRRRAPGTMSLLGTAAFFFAATTPVQAEDVYTFGVVPQQSATRLAQIWVPFLKELENRTGHKFRFTTAKDIPTFEACLARKAYDFAYMNPYHYTVMHDAVGYEAFAHQAGKRLKGVLVAKSDSSIEDLKDLDGESIAFPSPAAFGASVIPRAELDGQGVTFEPIYVKSHDSVYRAVALGLFPAGGGVVRTFGNLPDDLKSQLRVFHTTGSYTPHAFASSPDLDPGARDRISSEMIRIDDEDLLKSLGMKGFVAADNATWDDVRSLDLKVSQTEIAAAGDEICHSD